MPPRVYGRLAAASLVVVAALSACAPNSDTGPSRIADIEATPGAFHGTVLEPPPGRPGLILVDTDGQEFSLTDRPADEVTVVFFGYTHCPDVCPTTMADLAVAHRQLPTEVREQVSVVFVTEDPERDTPEALRRWLDQFDSTFVGLLGGNEATQTALTDLLLTESTVVPEPDVPVVHPDTGDGPHDHGDYSIEHTTIIYAFGPSEAAVIYTGGFSPRQYAEDFARLAAAA